MRAVVTGASQGIGLSVARRLADEGLDVLRVDRAGDAEHQCDITDEAAVIALADRVGPVDVLVNNAGVWHYGNLLDSTSEDLLNTIMVNLIGTVNCTRAFGRVMVSAARPGSIVNVVSIAAITPSPRVGTYSSSKAGVVALTRQTALEWGPYGIRCNAVGPGMITTDTTDEAAAAVGAKRSSAVPLRRLGTAEDVAEVVAFLASDRAAYVTGQVIYVDGGVTQALFELLP